MPPLEGNRVHSEAVNLGSGGQAPPYLKLTPSPLWVPPSCHAQHSGLGKKQPVIRNLCKQMNNGKHVCYSHPGAIHFVNLRLKLHQDAECLKRPFKHHTQQPGMINKLHLVPTVPAFRHPPPSFHPCVVWWSMLST